MGQGEGSERLRRDKMTHDPGGESPQPCAEPVDLQIDSDVRPVNEQTDNPSHQPMIQME